MDKKLKAYKEEGTEGRANTGDWGKAPLRHPIFTSPVASLVGLYEWAN